MSWRAFAAFFLSVLPLISQAGDSHPLAVLRDIEYARIGEHSLKLDFYLPRAKAKSPLIVWVHGGAWRSGSKSSMPLVEEDYPIVSIDYRLSTEAKFPAQIHDIKAAIRFVR